MTLTNVHKVTLALGVVTGLTVVFVVFQQAVVDLGRERALAAQGVLLGASTAILFTVVLVRRLVAARRPASGKVAPASRAEPADRR